MAITLRQIIIKTQSAYDKPVLIRTKKGFDSIESVELSDDGSFIILNTSYDQFHKDNNSKSNEDT